MRRREEGVEEKKRKRKGEDDAKVGEMERGKS